jgi:hypothetical protein
MSNQTNTADLNRKAEGSKGRGGGPMAALKEGSGTVPGGYAKLRGEHQRDLADIMSSDSAVGAVCLTC